MLDTTLRPGPDALGRRLLLAVVIVTLGFQTVHALEHVLQAGYWLLHPADAPWLTPWAAVGRDALAGLADGRPGSGSELLHLGGNLVFLAGLVAMAWLARSGTRIHRRWLRAAMALQGLHVAEHALLTVTWLVSGRALGVTTLFGALDGAVMGGVRVWAHFALNVVATAFAVAAVAPWASVSRRSRARWAANGRGGGRRGGPASRRTPAGRC